VMLAAIPLYAWLVGRFPRRRAVPLVYRFFLLNLLAFFALFQLGVAPAWVARAFFVWLSVYNLFVVSVFWSLMADVFTAEQGRRLFGFVAAGGTAGAIAGPALALALVSVVGVPGLVLLSALLLETAARCARRLARQAPPRTDRPAGAAEGGAIGGSLRSGLEPVFRSGYLRGIGLHILLYAVLSSFVYLQSARIVAGAIGDSARRTQLFAGIDLVVSLTQLATQLFVTGRVVTGLGVGATLAILPAVSVAGFAALAAVPTIWTVGGFQALRRAIHFGLDRPAREVLFTVVSREEKYKAKGFIDTVVYRFGDVLGAWTPAALGALGLGVAGVSLVGVPIAAGAVGLAVWLGRRQRSRETAPPSPPLHGRGTAVVKGEIGEGAA
jgi:ATP:ADP antiporter, AAA family